MKVKHLLPAATAAGLAIASLPSAAHHGQAGLFDEERTVELKGTVKEWHLVNPHPVLVLEAPDAAGQPAEWDVYFGPAAVSFMRQRGFTAGTFMTGETIVVVGHPATTAGALGVDVWGTGTSVTRADGTAIP